jgi:protein-S-isoprenylcysteine O-methyltransferase Ste14
MFAFGVFGHVLFLAVFAYMALFVAGVPFVPKTIDGPATHLWPGEAMLVNALLLALFAVPHSVMARPAFKRWWTQFVAKPVERSVYVMFANVSVIVLMWLWQPMTAVVWDVHAPAGRAALWALFLTGWLLVPLASLMIDHFDLFGTRQVWLHLRGRVAEHVPFHTPWLYRFIRHPLYVGWMIAFWATPTMTAGHVMFAAFLTVYMLVAIPMEERDLVDVYGEKYEDYRRRVPALVPRVSRGGKDRDGSRTEFRLRNNESLSPVVDTQS